MKVAIASILSLITLTAVGSYYQFAVIPYVVIGAVIAVTVLIALDKIKPREYPIYLFGLSLALVWQTSMLGSYIVGVDVHTEYYVANQAIANGWDINWANNNNTSVVMGLFTPLLAKVGFPPIMQFKLLYPFIFGLTPVILYYAFKGMVGEKRAYFACLFIMIMPMFTIEALSVAKSMVALPCLALVVLFAARDMAGWKKALGIVLATTGAVVCHYSVGAVTVGFLIGAFVVLLVLQIPKLRGLFGESKPSLGYMGVVAGVGLAVLYLWTSTVGGGGMWKTFVGVGENIVRVSVATFDGEDGVSVTELEEKYKGRTMPIEKTGTYLDSQEPLVRTGLGLDWAISSISGKVFRVLQYLTQLLLVAGLFVMILWRKRYKFTGEYGACVVVGFGLLGVCALVPYFTTIISTTRFYMMALLFVAPMFVLGIEGIAGGLKASRADITKRASVAFCVLLACYYMFTSGLVFEVTKDTTLEKVNMPYSVALSNYRTGIVAMPSEGDLDCARWVAYQRQDGLPVWLDYCASSLLLGENYGIGMTYDKPKGAHYLFLTSWDIEHNQMVFGKSPGLRSYENLPNLDGAEVAFKSGESAVYRFGVDRTWDKETVTILFMDVRFDPPDFWANNPNYEVWMQWWNDEVVPHTEAKILPLLEFARANDMVIVFVSNDVGSEARELVPRLNASPIINDPSELVYFLQERGIGTILYAGYASNMCILARSTGMRAMDSVGYNVILIEDCSLPVPAIPLSYEEALDEIKTKYGGTITMAELEERLRDADAGD